MGVLCPDIPQYSIQYKRFYKTMRMHAMCLCKRAHLSICPGLCKQTSQNMCVCLTTLSIQQILVCICMYVNPTKFIVTTLCMCEKSKDLKILKMCQPPFNKYADFAKPSP